jgi:hypothetical protein
MVEGEASRLEQLPDLDSEGNFNKIDQAYKPYPSEE